MCMAVGQYIPLVLIVYLFIGSTEVMCIGISLEGSTVLRVNCVWLPWRHHENKCCFALWIYNDGGFQSGNYKRDLWVLWPKYTLLWHLHLRFCKATIFHVSKFNLYCRTLLRLMFDDSWLYWTDTGWVCVILNAERRALAWQPLNMQGPWDFVCCFLFHFHHE